ncbi:MAG TPA: signal recognition particle protein [Spirochaetota bacterium]|mgnify:CR=1 FL=1|nr:signal recognition particle protein [Spirochaetota bacterium]HOS31735.1 signal recognition particle protein [Spirochaetota bacterium]HOS54559.1 signal recognition particle protein [Spirochaetota bacterium]HPK61291.1 signal recognition particle protein [Spirochaetota bacterium]HQF77201.1 signal recognition particle protein [Spirochaetota bacterium]
MLDGISKSLTDIFRNMSGKSVINENNIKSAIQEIRIALLEADVNISVVRSFVKFVTEESIGEKVIRSVNPREYFIKIVNDKLVEILGSKNQDIILKPKDTLSVIMLAGLQGSGKTTSAGKLAYYLKKKEERKILLAACDVYRPAAIDQLIRVGEMADVEVFTGDKKDPIKIAKEALKYARENKFDTLILDTAGRLHIDVDMMNEVQKLAKETKPDEVLFVADSMTGQTAADIAKEFDNYLGVSGIILTKFDSDARGGAALSIKSVLNKPIKFIGVSEKVDGLEVFYPDRIASRILGMGDIVSLVEKAEEIYDQEEAEKLEKKIRKSEFTLQDFLDQLNQMNKMGSIENILEMIPGMKGRMGDINIDEKKIARQKAIIQSMTMREREDFRLIMGPRKRRIAKGAGVTILDVDNLLKNFQKSRQMMKNVIKGKGKYGNLDMGKMF